jgi:DNA (cytosine-5)-methyltransferase 1
MMSSPLVGAPTGLSLFAGVGGLDLGARVAGLDVRLATDADASALDLLKRSTGCEVLVGDIEDVTGLLADAWPSPSGPDVIIGGPPCTGFSHAGFWLGDKRAGLDPATALLESYLEVVRIFRPRGFVLENVPGLAFKTHARFLERFLHLARSAGYSVTCEVLDASAFGVAQARRRLFIVGAFGRPAVDLTRWHALPRRSAGWALRGSEGLQPEPDEQPGGEHGHLLPLVPPGSNYLHFTDKRGWDPPLFKYRGRYWSFLLKIDPDRPSPTVPAQRVTFNGPFHWSSRHLRVREMARLQGFPDDHPHSSNLGLARRHVGNAVPPPLAAAVVWRLLATLGAADIAPPPLFDVLADPDARYEEVSAAITTAA